MKKKTILALLIIIIGIHWIYADDKPKFWEDVQTIQKYDKIYAPPANPILFIGSSSFRRWDALERTFAKFNVINRGLGGAVINDVTAVVDDIVFPYQPRQIFIYVGENDIQFEHTNGDSIFTRTKRLIDSIRVKLPFTPIVYLSIKYSPVREKFISKAIRGNQLLKAYISTQKNIQFLDVFHLTLNHEGKPDTSLFLSDKLHLNLKGYKIWKKALRPLLIK